MSRAESSKINGLKGGRPKGKRNARTLEKEAILRAYEQRVMKLTDKLMNAQLTLAFGQTFLYKIEKELVIGPKGGKSYKSKRPELVTNQHEIELFLENELENHELHEPGATYYFLTTKEPDGQTIDSMFKRVFGPPKHTIVTEDLEGNKMPIGSINIVPIMGDEK